MQKFTTAKQLIDFLNTNNSPILATVTVKTEQKMNKKDVATKKIPNPHGPIFKISQMQLTLNADYEQLVNFGQGFDLKRSHNAISVLSFDKIIIA